MILAIALGGCAATGQPQPRAGTETASLPQLMRLAEKSRRAGNHAVAANIYRKAIERYPGNAQPYIGLGDIALATGEVQEATRSYRAALDRRPASRAARHGLGKALVASDRLGAAVEQFDMLIDSGVRDHRPYLARGVAFDMMGRHAAAQASYRAGLKLAPDNVALRNNLGLSLALSRNYHDGMRVLEDLARDPTAPARTRQNLALVYGMVGKMQQAASTAGQDLSPRVVERNLAYYRTLRELRTPQEAARDGKAAPATGRTGDAPPDRSAASPAASVPAGKRGAPIQLASAIAVPHHFEDAGPKPAQTSPSSPPDDSASDHSAPARSASAPASPDSDSAEPGHRAGTPATAKAEPAAERTEGVAAGDRHGRESGADAAAGSLAAQLATLVRGDSAGDAAYWVQLGAYGTPKTGRKAWQRLQQAHPDLVGGLPLSLQVAEIPDKGTFHRVRTGPFADKKPLKSLCKALAKRGQGCYVVRTIFGGTT